MRKNLYLLLSIICITAAGCGQSEPPAIVVDELPAQTASEEPSAPQKTETGETAHNHAPLPPSKEQVSEMREICLEGMEASAIQRLCENIKAANMAMENAYFYDGLFNRLSDKEDLYWNYIDQKGDITIGYTLGEGQEYDKSSGLTYEEYAKEYGQPVTAYNRFDAENFISLMREMQDSLYAEELKDDFNRLITDMSLAKRSHDVEYVEDIYHILHDMDYYLLRYAPEDLGKYVTDPGTILTYYDILNVYHPEKDSYWMDLQEE